MKCRKCGSPMLLYPKEGYKLAYYKCVRCGYEEQTL